MAAVLQTLHAGGGRFDNLSEIVLMLQLEVFLPVCIGEWRHVRSTVCVIG